MHGAARDLETETRAPSLTGEDPSEPPPPSFADYLRHASLLGLPSRTTGDARDPSEPSNLGTVSAALSPDRPRGSHPSLVASPAGLAAQARPSPEIASPPRSKQRRVSFGGLASGPTPSAPPSAPISAEARRMRRPRRLERRWRWWFGRWLSVLRRGWPLPIGVKEGGRCVSVLPPP